MKERVVHRIQCNGGAGYRDNRCSSPAESHGMLHPDSGIIAQNARRCAPHPFRGHSSRSLAGAYNRVWLMDPLKTLAVLCKSLATMLHSGVRAQNAEIASRKTGNALSAKAGRCQFEVPRQPLPRRLQDRTGTFRVDDRHGLSRRAGGQLPRCSTDWPLTIKHRSAAADVDHHDYLSGSAASRQFSLWRGHFHFGYAGSAAGSGKKREASWAGPDRYVGA